MTNTALNVEKPTKNIILASDAYTPASKLAELAKDTSQQVREAVAEHPSTPVYALKTLGRDENATVRYGVAANPSTPVPTLQRWQKMRRVWYAAH